MLSNKKYLVIIIIVLFLMVLPACSETETPDPAGADAENLLLYEEAGIEAEVEVEAEDSLAPLAVWTAGEADLTEYAAKVITLANTERQKAGLTALTATEELTAAASVRASELTELFSHKRPNGKSCFTVYGEYNVLYRAAAENIAAGQRTPEEAIESWMNSPGHKANILSEKFGHIGIGVEADAAGKLYWSMNFTD